MTRKAFNPDRDVAEWNGPKVPYDLLKEFAIAMVVVTLVVVGLAVVFSSPDDPAVTLQSWAQNSPVDFAQTALSELDGSSGTAQYGPPYNAGGAPQSVAGISPERWVGVHIPVNTAQDFVFGPLATLAGAPGVHQAVAIYQAASDSQKAAWATAYGNALASARTVDGHVVVARGHFGPVALMIQSLTAMAERGGLSGPLPASSQFSSVDQTKPLLFLSDGSYFAGLGSARNLTGDQWGMMNETGNYPGQAWLWLYTMWYQVPPIKSSSSADLLVWMIMIALTAVLALVPFIPGLRSIPRWTRVYRLIWRNHYRQAT